MTLPEQKSNEVLANDIANIKSDILEIKQKLDSKYVSHETFDLVITSLKTDMLAGRLSLQEADSRIIKTAMFVITPIYGAVIVLLFKLVFN